MTALNFPSSPTLNQTYSANGKTYLWNGTSWVAVQQQPISSSYAITASYALNGGGGGGTVSSSYPFAITGSTLYSNYETNRSPLSQNLPTTESIIIGANAGTNGVLQHSVLIGNNAGASSSADVIGYTSIGYSVMIGDSAGASSTNYYDGNSGSSYSVMIGEAAGRRASTEDVVFIGFYAGESSIKSGYSVMIGESAGINTVDVENSVFVGPYAGDNTEGAYESVFIGNNSGQYVSQSRTSVSIGANAGQYAINSPYNNFIGNLAGASATNSQLNTFIGSFAGQNMNYTDYSDGIGYGAGYDIVSSSQSSFIGKYAGQRAFNPNKSSFIGVDAGAYSRNITNSLFFGEGVGTRQASSSYSTLIGYRVALRSASSDSSTSIGPNNIIIGTNITLPTNRQDSINIGGILFGTGSHANILLTNPYSGSVGNGRIGINVVDPQYTLHVSGSSFIQAPNQPTLTVQGNTSPTINVQGTGGTGSFTVGADVNIGSVSNNTFGFLQNNTVAWYINTNKAFVPNVNNSYDIGLTGTRVRTVWATNISSSNPISSASVAISSSFATSASWAPSGVSISYASASITGDINLVANSYTVGPSVSLSAGTWLVSATATVREGTGAQRTYYARISDGTTHYASTEATDSETLAGSWSLSLSTVIVLSGTATIGLYVTTNTTTGTPAMKAAQSANGSGNNATMITAVKIG